MKKFLCIMLALILIFMSSPVMGKGEVEREVERKREKKEVRVGFLAKLSMTQEEFQAIVMSERKTNGWQLMALNHDKGERFQFYDSLTDMLMALSSGRIDEAAFPKVVGEYVLNSNPDIKIASVTQVKTMGLVFGFKDTARGSKLREDFNKALSEIKSDGTLDKLVEKYLSEPGLHPLEATEFEGETIRVAVTGDLPPIDYVEADGKPAGFSTAVLAELGRRLRMNIEVIDTDSGARTELLISERVDVVFWYEIVKDLAKQIDADASQGILLSEPYYDWNVFLYVGEREKQN